MRDDLRFQVWELLQLVYVGRWTFEAIRGRDAGIMCNVVS